MLIIFLLVVVGGSFIALMYGDKEERFCVYINGQMDRERR